MDKKIAFLYMVALNDGIDALLLKEANKIPELSIYYWKQEDVYWSDARELVEGLLKGENDG